MSTPLRDGVGGYRPEAIKMQIDVCCAKPVRYIFPDSKAPDKSEPIDDRFELLRGK